MKHILRLLVVAGICIGLFFGITAIVNNKKPYSIVTDYASVRSDFKTLDTNISRLNGMTEAGMDKFFQYNTIYSFNKNSLNEYVKIIETLNLSKKENGEFKTIKSNLTKQFKELNARVNKIYEYNFNEAHPNSDYLAGLIVNANEIFVEYDKTLNNACLKLANYINSEVYNGLNYNFKDVLVANILNMNKVYLETDKGYTYVTTAITNYNNFISSARPSTTDASAFVQNYYTFTNESLLENYQTYFNQGTNSNVNFATLIDFVLKGEYYEEA